MVAVLQSMALSNPQTVADSKRRFYAAYPHVIPGLYRRVVDELLVELHLLAGQAGFQADSLFAMGLTQVFDNLMQGFKPAERQEDLFAAICSGAGLKADQLRKDAKQLREQLVPHGEAEIKSWIEQQGQGAPDVLKRVLQQAGRSDFHYSRLHAVGLMGLLQDLSGGDDQDPQALQERAHQLGHSMGLQKDKLQKDMGLYASNLEKMSQAVELLEETVAAERRKREQRQGEPAAAATGQVSEPAS
jgi:photosystem II biogenesis protein Psp29